MEIKDDEAQRLFKKFSYINRKITKDKCQKEIQKIKEKLIGAKIFKNILKYTKAEQTKREKEFFRVKR